MEINFGKYRPIVLKTEVNKLEKILYHRYFLTKIEFDKILIEIPCSLQIIPEGTQ